MNILDIAIVLLIFFIIIKLYMYFQKTTYKSNNNELFTSDKSTNNLSNKSIKQNKKISFPSLINSNSNKKHKNKIKLNQHFQDMQFHSDYRDTLNAFVLLSPNQKQLFNKSDLPLSHVVDPPSNEFKILILDFIKEINKTIKNNITNEVDISNGWQDNLPEKIHKSGWDKEQETLGLPNSIYKEPAQKAIIKLLKVDKVEKYETDEQIKYSIILIAQKKNVNDQIIFKVSFVLDKNDVNLDREFFDKKKNTYNAIVHVEEISVIGFLTNIFNKTLKNKCAKSKSRENFYQFDNISDGKMFSQKDIIKVLNQKRRDYDNENHE
jgi:hypothetical protein